MSTDRILGSTRWPRARKRLRSDTPTAPDASGSTDPPRSTTRVASFRRRFDWAWIRARVAARGIPPGDIDDVAQEVVIAMSEAEPRLVIPTGKRAADVRRSVLHTIVRRRVAQYWKNRADEPTEVQARSEVEQGIVRSAEEEALVHGPSVALHEALRELAQTNSDAHAVVVAYELEGEAMSVLAARLKIAENTCWNRLRAGRLGLRDIFRRREAGERFARVSRAG